jgi:hypothetical protein
MFLGILNPISKAYATSVRTQMCIIIDGSSSVSDARWNMTKNGVAEAINSTIPKDGSVELTIVQFGYSASNGSAKTELPPTVVDDGNFAAIIDIVLAMPKGNYSTAMADGIFLGWTELRNSPNFALSEEQVINLATDGEANIRNYNATSDLDGSGGSPDAHDDVIAVVNYAVSQGLDELDVEGIGNFTLYKDWLEIWVVRPQPAHLAPPFNPGWIRLVTDSLVFAETLGEKFNAVLDDTNPPNITDVYQLPPADNVTSKDTVEVFANVTDDLSGVRQVLLNYTIDGSEPYSVVMSNLQGNKYNATIPAFANGTHVTYVVVAEDFANNSITTQSMGYILYYDYYVIPELPTSLLLLVFMIATLLSVIVYRRRHALRTLEQHFNARANCRSEGDSRWTNMDRGSHS